jgi:hypothetical protein
MRWLVWGDVDAADFVRESLACAGIPTVAVVLVKDEIGDESGRAQPDVVLRMEPPARANHVVLSALTEEIRVRLASLHPSSSVALDDR